MAQLHGRFAPRISGGIKDPGADTVNTTPDLDHLKREAAIPATPPSVDSQGRPWATSDGPEGGPGTRLGDWKATPEEKAEQKAALIRAGKYVDPEDPNYKAWMAERRRLNIKDAIASQDPMADKTTNASGFAVKTPGGLAKHHAEKQLAALELAKGSKGSMRKFALELAKRSAQDKRAAIAAGGGGGKGQKRVPSGQPTGGRWTK